MKNSSQAKRKRRKIVKKSMALAAIN